MKKIDLKAEKREIGEKLNKLRAEKTVPGVVYGRKQEPVNIKINNSEIVSLINKHGKTHIISLSIGRKKIDCIIHDYQNDPVRGNFIHMDFYAITSGEKITTEIPLNFIGESEAKKQGAKIEERVKEIEVKCLSEDLVDSFDVDLTLIKKEDDMIKISDLGIDKEKYDIISNVEEVVAAAYVPKENVIEETTEEDNQVGEDGEKSEEKESGNENEEK